VRSSEGARTGQLCKSRVNSSRKTDKEKIHALKEAGTLFHEEARIVTSPEVFTHNDGHTEKEEKENSISEGVWSTTGTARGGRRNHSIKSVSSHPQH
jgi:hypothetical protein